MVKKIKDYQIQVGTALKQINRILKNCRQESFVEPINCVCLGFIRKRVFLMYHPCFLAASKRTVKVCNQRIS